MISEDRLKEIEKDIFDFDTGEFFNLDLVDFVEHTRYLLRERKELIKHRDLSFAVIEACEYHKGKLPKELREKLDFWLKEYKIDERTDDGKLIKLSDLSEEERASIEEDDEL